MTLRSLLRLLGLAELARRAGVSPATIKRWQRTGPSARGQETLDQVARRRRAGIKGAQTKVRRAAFRDSLPIPVDPLLNLRERSAGEYDDPRDLVPNRPPIETAADLRRVAARGGHDIGHRIETDTYTGESVWVAVSEPLVNVDQDRVIDTAIDIWQQSGRNWSNVLCMFFRFIPFNPLYRGEMVAKQGKWFPWWTSSVLAATINSIADGIAVALREAYGSAESRLIWFEGYLVRTFDIKPDAPRDWRERHLS